MKEGMANARKRIDKENADKAAWNALREIAAGHNDPRTLAQETLKLLEE